jgi:hypothetical protein
MNFQRGKDPKEALGIGKEAILREINGIIVEESDWTDEYSSIVSTQNKNNVVIMHRNDGRYAVIKNSIAFSDHHISEYLPDPVDERELFSLLNKLLEAFRKFGLTHIFVFPKATRVAARTIGADLVPVKPMSSPESKRWKIYPKEDISSYKHQ